MKKKLCAVLASGLLVIGITGSANAVSIITDSTMGYYNSSIGTSLNLTNAVGSTYLFPGDYMTYGDPTFNPVPFEPDLTAAAAALGNWLVAPGSLNANWNLQMIPSSWKINDETAIVYKFDAGPGYMYSNVVAKFGVDNGLFVWLDGAFLNGWLAPGGSSQWEYTQTLGSLTSGTHYLQILREDHGGSDSFTLNVSGDVAPVPEPSTMLLLSSGLLGLVALNRRRKA